jgi:ABC-type phosphate/phosphonate transport system substrate-binding protein
MRVLLASRKTTFLAQFLLFALLGNSVADGRAQPPGNLRVGVIESVFPDQTPAEAKANLVPLNKLVQRQLNMPCNSAIAKDAWELGRQLEARKLDLGVLHGFEFAWLIEKNARLKPLVIAAVGNDSHPIVYLVALRSSPIKSFADLQGKQIALPIGSRAAVQLVLARVMAKEKGLKVSRPQNIEDGLDQVVLGKEPAAVVDAVSFDAYRVVKPGAWKKLRIVQQSARFPSAVVIYRDGALDANMLKRIDQGLVSAHKDSRNKVLMDEARISYFAAIPADFQKNLVTIRAAYPAQTKP